MQTRTILAEQDAKLTLLAVERDDARAEVARLTIERDALHTRACAAALALAHLDAGIKAAHADGRVCQRCAEMDGWGCEVHQGSAR
jgi:hypothetical protein